jgi:parallel beta-helix repeat protein
VVNGVDPNQDTITIRAARTVIDGLTVTGGRSGIVIIGSATIKNCLVQTTGRVGIFFNNGGQGTVDYCTVDNNARHGICIEGASATVTNSTISSNTVNGIAVQRGGNARIGINVRSEYAGNTIINNKGNGIGVSAGGSAFIGGNKIQDNSNALNTVQGYFGIGVANATAILVGNNTITGNAGSGVFAKGSNVKIGEAAFDLPFTDTYANVITGNGAKSPTNGGVYGFLGSSLEIQYANINNNIGNGVGLSVRSTARMIGGTVNGNSGHGFLLSCGGGLLLWTPAAVTAVTGNSGFGIDCLDGESSFAGNTTGISGNTGGQVNCSGF